MARTAVVLLSLLVALAGPAAAEKPPKPATPAEAADAVAAAVEKGDGDALKALALADDPDPWLVASELCDREAHDAAGAFAKAAPRTDTEGIPAFVEARRGGAAGVVAEARKAFAAAEKGNTVEAFLEAARIAEEGGWLAKASLALRGAGVVAFLADDYPTAWKQWKARLDLEERRGGPLGIAKALHNLALVTDNLGDPVAALALYERARALQEENGFLPELLMTLENMATLYVHVGRFAAGEPLLRRALEVGKELGAPRGAPMMLVNLAIVHRARGEYVESLGRCREGLEAVARTPNPVVYQLLLHNQGTVLNDLGDPLGAAESLGKALTMARAMGDAAAVTSAENGLGISRLATGESRRALAHFEKAIAGYRSASNALGEARALSNMGALQEAMGDHAHALSLFEESLAIFEARKDQRGMATCLGNLGISYFTIGDGERALECQRASLKLERLLGDPGGIASSEVSIGNILYARGDMEGALEAYGAALRTLDGSGVSRGRTQVILNLGNLHLDLGKPERALELLDEACGMAKKAGIPEPEAIARLNRGEVLRRLGEQEKALAEYGRSADLARAAGATAPLVAALAGRANSLLALDRAEEALEAVREAEGLLPLLVRGLSEETGALSREAQSIVHEAGVLAALAAGDPVALCEFLERGRAGNLLESLRVRESLRGDLLPPEMFEEEAGARARETAASAALRRAEAAKDAKGILAARKDLGGARDRVRAVVARIQREQKAAASIVYPEPDSLETIRSRLGAEEVLVSYGIADGGMTALVATAEGARIVPLGPAAPVGEAVALLDPEAKGDGWEGALESLRKSLVEPLGLGEEATRVLVAPDGEIAYVPFGALLPGRETVLVPSGTVLGLLLEEAGKRGEGVLALGDPDYGAKGTTAASLRGGRERRPLPATRDEAKAVGTTVLLGKEATEGNLVAALAKRERWRAVHLACHGFVEAETPVLSCLALTAAGEDDGDLTVLEVFRMRIPADLVVLSACETGRGRVVRGEGIMGLTRAFMFAGAPRVLVSLWKVEDRATRALMETFYERWNAGAAPAAALREAQAFVASREEWRHPRYWAAWVLWGLPE